MADSGQRSAGIGQNLFGVDGAGTEEVRVGKKQIVIPGQRRFLREESVKPLQGAVGPGQGLLRDAAHIGVVFPRNLRGVGKDKEGFIQLRQKVLAEVFIKPRPEHPV